MFKLEGEKGRREGKRKTGHEKEREDKRNNGNKAFVTREQGLKGRKENGIKRSR